MGVGAMLILLSGCGAGSSAFKTGRNAETRKDWDTALINYEKAVESQPGNALYLIHQKQARTQAAIYHQKKGRELLAGGRLDEALGEFQKAVGIDPSNAGAAQELTQLLAAQAAARQARQEALQDALKAREETPEDTGMELKPFPTEPLAHFRITADSKRVYETLCKLADLNVAFTADFRAQPLTVDLTNVKLEDALNIVAFQTKSFWRPVTDNTILVIQDTPANRRDFAEQVVKTIYLSNPLQPADRTAITTALKQVLGLQRIIDNPDANAIIIRDTPDKVAAAEKLITDLDRGKAEILVEVSILEADSNRIRDLGLTLVATSPLPATSIAGVGFNPAEAASSGVAAVPLNRLGKISTKDFSIVLPGAIANALLSDSHTHILQNPQVRVTDGQTAKLRIGSRIPYATGSFLPSLGGGTGGAGLIASTQFQYQDVGVNLDLTPRLLPSGEVALHAMIEISSLGASVDVGGLKQPTFGQRRIEHDIRLKEGEISLLGGLLERTERISTSGLPGLGQIPFLRYLFSSEHKEFSDTEVLVMLTPHVIRLPERVQAKGARLAIGGDTGGGPVPQVVPAIPQPPVETPPEGPGQPQ
jgi:general secretion pathway protein D